MTIQFKNRLALFAAALACTPRPEGVAPASPPQSAPPPAQAWFADDFEDDAPGQPPGKPWRDETGSSGASVRVDTTRAFSGQRSVHVTAPGGAAYRRGYFAIHEPPVFPAAARAMYGRVMVWLEAAPEAPPGGAPVHWTFIQGEGRSGTNTYNSLYRYGGQHQGGLGLMANFETTPPTRSDCWQHSKSTLPVQAWACVEWHFDGAKNEMQLWLDGKELTDLHVVDRGQGSEAGCLSTEHLGGQWLAPPAFQSLYLGWERYQETVNDQHLWLDDAVVAGERVGCPAPRAQAPRAAGTRAIERSCAPANATQASMLPKSASSMSHCASHTSP